MQKNQKIKAATGESEKESGERATEPSLLSAVYHQRP
jgi:hypothetical protein